MAETATITADSSPSEVLKSLTPAQTKEWRNTGKLPDLPEAPPKETKTDAESSPAAKESSEPAKAETVVTPVVTKEEPKPKGAEARIKELLAETKRLSAELEAARKVPVIAPAKVEEVAKPHRNDVDSKTGQAVYATDEAFDKAFEEYLTNKVTADVEKRQAKAQQEARLKEQNEIIAKRWQNSLKIATEKNPDWAKVVEVDEKGNFQNAGLKTIKTNGVLDAWILDSEIGADILYHLAKNPEEIERIQSLGPFSAARELTKLEEKLSGTSTPKEEPKADSPKPKVTGAPAPAASISGKATAPVDEAEAALKQENFRAYAKAANDAEYGAKRKKG